jgi:DNA mismatch repair protein MutS
MSLVADYYEKLAQYKKEYGEKTIVLMQVGVFYEVYGNDMITDIYEFSEKCDLSIANKSDTIKMSGFRDYMLEKYLKKLHQHLYTVVVFVQDEQKSGTTRSLLGIYSPGTYFQNTEFYIDPRLGSREN